MKLTKVEIVGFRSIAHLELPLTTLTTLIGKNSAGKSNVLRAIRFFFTASPKALALEDICTLERGEPNGTWIECTFGSLTDGERDSFSKYVLSDETMRVRRTLETDDDGNLKSTRHGWVEEADEEWLREGFDRYNDSSFWQEIGIDVFDYAERTASGNVTRAAHRQFIEEYLKRHRDTVSLSSNLSPSEFRGRSSTATSELPNLVFIPAAGDIIPQVYGRKTSLLNQVVAGVLRARADCTEFSEAERAVRRVEDLVNPSDHRLPEFDAIERHLEKQLGSWPGVSCAICAQVDRLVDLLASSVRLDINDGSKNELALKGDGMQRQLLFAVVRLFADFRQERGNFAQESNADSDAADSSIILFEEPELFLHPQAQESFYDDLLAISKTDQIVLSTHSNHLIRLDYAESINIIRRASSSAPSERFGASSAYKETDADDRARLKEIALMSGDMSRIFFADRVIVTEGPEDVIFIKAAAEQGGFIDRAVTVVSAGSKDSIPTLQRVLNEFSIPYFVVCDHDDNNGKSRSTSVRIWKEVLKLRGSKGVANMYEFHPCLPSHCYVETSPPTSEKPLNAARLVRNKTLPEEFVDQIRRIYEDRDNTSNSTAVVVRRP